MRGAHSRVALDHAQRLPTAFLPHCLQVDAGHHAVAGPVMPPVMNVKIDDAGATTRRGVRFLDRAATRHFVLTRIAIRLTAIGQENRPLGR